MPLGLLATSRSRSCHHALPSILQRASMPIMKCLVTSVGVSHVLHPLWTATYSSSCLECHPHTHAPLIISPPSFHNPGIPSPSSLFHTTVITLCLLLSHRHTHGSTTATPTPLTVNPSLLPTYPQSCSQSPKTHSRVVYAGIKEEEEEGGESVCHLKLQV